MPKTALALINKTIRKLENKNNKRANDLATTKSRVEELATKIVADYTEHMKSLHKVFCCCGGARQSIDNMDGYHQIVYRNDFGTLTFGYMISSDYTPYVDIAVNDKEFRVLWGPHMFVPLHYPDDIKAMKKFLDSFDMGDFDKVANKTLKEVAKKYA